MAKVVIEKPNLDMDPMFGPHRMENGKLPQQQGQMQPEIPGGQQMGGYQPQMGGGGEYLQGGGGQGYPNEMNEFFQVECSFFSLTRGGANNETSPIFQIYY